MAADLEYGRYGPIIHIRYFVNLTIRYGRHGTVVELSLAMATTGVV